MQGRSDIPLNEYGRELARITRRGLDEEGVSFDAAFTSPLVRAVETAQILLEGTGVTPVTDERLVEIDFGKYEGFSIPEVQENPEYSDFAKCFEDPANYHPDEGESFYELYDRCGAFVKEVLIPLEKEARSVLITAHGALIRGLMNVIDNTPVERFWDRIQRNCAVNKLTLTDGVFATQYEGRIYYKEEHIYKSPSDKWLHLTPEA